MKNTFRIILFIILALIIAFTLLRNKKSINLETRNAKQPITRIPVRTFKVKKDIPVKVIKAAGIVNAEKESYIVSTQAGEIVEIKVKAGDFIEKGKLVARVNDFYSRQEYEIARQAYEQLKKDFERYKNLSETEAVTGQQMEQLKLQVEGAETKMNTLKKRLDETLIRSTIAGYVNQVLVKTGGMLGQGSPVCEIVNPGILTINTGLPIPDIHFIQRGMPAKILFDFGNGRRLDARVKSKGVKPDYSGKYPVILEFENPVKNILPGTIVDIEIIIKGDSSFLIPSSSLIQYQGKEGVFLLKNGYAIFKSLETGERYDTEISVKNDIEKGMEVISDGAQLVEDSSQVVVITQ